jgi:hypothetical protein
MFFEKVTVADALVPRFQLVDYDETTNMIMEAY